MAITTLAAASTLLNEDITSSRVAYLALGSNLGDRAANIDDAIARLHATPGIAVLRRASVIETAPMYVTDQPVFLNTAIAIETTLTPHELLTACLAVETAMGRIRAVDKGPRLIDVDIILYADRVIDEPDLCIPHPAMFERDFVMIPLREIAPDMVHPVTGLPIAT